MVLDMSVGDEKLIAPSNLIKVTFFWTEETAITLSDQQSKLSKHSDIR